MMASRLERLKELLKQSPGDSFIRFAMAKELEKEGLHREAIDVLTALLADEPDYIGAYYHLAGLLAGCDDVNEALRIYDKGILAATRLGDRHALSELKNARLNLEMGSS